MTNDDDGDNDGGDDGDVETCPMITRLIPNMYTIFNYEVP